LLYGDKKEFFKRRKANGRIDKFYTNAPDLPNPVESFYLISFNRLMNTNDQKLSFIEMSSYIDLYNIQDKEDFIEVMIEMHTVLRNHNQKDNDGDEW